MQYVHLPEFQLFLFHNYISGPWLKFATYLRLGMTAWFVCVRVLTSCLQAEIFSDLLVVTWMGEVKDAVTSEVHLQNRTKNSRLE